MAALGDLASTGGEPLGWFRNGERVVWHNGRTATHCGSFAIDIVASEAWCVLWNASSTVDDIVLATSSRGSVALPSTPPPMVATDAELEAFVGAYRGWLGEFSLRRDARGSLVLDGRGYGRIPLFVMRENALRSLDLSLRLERTEGGIVEHLRAYPARIRLRT